MIGTQLGPYRILALLGRGGFAEVYRARDDRLGRDVAVKVLHAKAPGGPEAAARIVREARAVAALNHPNIAVIHEVAEFGGRAAIVMELVDGRPLAESIPPDGLPSERVARWGAQIADALAHAHARGIVHRDLKGSNVVVTPEGRVKLLDFGLARGAGAPAEFDIALTQTGVLSGTPAFMAPEILRGGTADAKSDLWALGVLLYQMASGRLPFEGTTFAETSAAVLTTRPRPLPARVPAALRSIIERCLARDPARRPASATDVHAALESPSAGGVDREGTAATNSRVRLRQIAAFAVIAALAGFALWRSRAQTEAPAHEPTQRQLTSNPDGDPVYFSYLSPDGVYLAYADAGGAHVRAVEGGETRTLLLPRELAISQLGSWADWAPDGTRLLVSGELPDGRSTIWSVPALGGASRLVVDDGEEGSFSPDGSAIAFVRNGARGPELWQAASDGTNPRRITASDSAGVIAAYSLAWSPTGRRIAYARRGTTREGRPIVRIETTDLAGAHRTLLPDSLAARLHVLTAVAWMPDGRIVFALSEPAPNASDMNLWTVPVDAATGIPKGAPQRRTNLMRVSYPLPSRPTKDGARMAVSLLQYPTDIYVGTMARPGAPLEGVRRLTLDNRDDDVPSWSRDGRTVLFSSDRNGTFDLFEQDVDSTSAVALATGAGDQVAPQVSADDRFVLYWDYRDVLDPQAGARLVRMPRGGGPGTELLRTLGNAAFRLAHDGSWGLLLTSRGDSVVVSAFDPERGPGASLARLELPHWAAGDVSPDGHTLAWSMAPDSSVRIRLFDLTSRTWRSIAVPALRSIQGIAREPHGVGWYVYGPADAGWRILYVHPDGKATPILPSLPWMRGFAVSPDGRRLAFARNTVQSNAWIFEGL